MKRLTEQDVKRAFTAFCNQAEMAGKDASNWRLQTKRETGVGYTFKYSPGVYVDLGITAKDAIKAIGFMRDGFALHS